jgi:hypothetical protein
MGKKGGAARGSPFSLIPQKKPQYDGSAFASQHPILYFVDGLSDGGSAYPFEEESDSLKVFRTIQSLSFLDANLSRCGKENQACDGSF